MKKPTIAELEKILDDPEEVGSLEKLLGENDPLFQPEPEKEHDMPIDDDRRSEGYKWCRLHGWFFATCDKCVDDKVDK